jgi:hypothetical protein
MKTTADTAFHLRLWLPGYHTPSGNGTVGKHWSLVYQLKKAVAGHLLYGMQNLQGDASVLPPVEITNAASRVLGKIAMGVRLPTKRGKKPEKPAVPARLRIERVTVSLCDEDNFKGGTKGLVDCLRYAFPTVLLDDAPGYVVMEHVQTKCGSKCEQGTWVELEAPDFGKGMKEQRND